MKCIASSVCALSFYLCEGCASDGAERSTYDLVAVHSQEFASHLCVHTTTLRSCSDPTFFNTLFVSLGIASPLSPSPSSDYSPPRPECVPTVVYFATHGDRVGEHNRTSRPTLRPRRGSPSKNPQCRRRSVYRHTCRHADDTSCRYIRRLTGGRAAILVQQCSTGFGRSISLCKALQDRTKKEKFLLNSFILSQDCCALDKQPTFY